MAQLDFQPEMIGRENELKDLQEHLNRVSQGQGSTLLISGEAGIGKTRLLEEIKNIAQSKGFQILSGNSLYESLTPYMPFLEALRSGGMESLFAEEAPKVEAVYLVTNTGLLVKEVLREETELDPDIFASMLTTVGDFVKDSLSMLSGEEREGMLNSLGYENHRILIESGKDTNLAVILSGRENEFLINDMKEVLLNVNTGFGNTLKQWDGNEESVRGIENTLQPLITSGKYDGIYYGLEDPEARRNLLFENVSLGLTRQARTTPTLLCIEDLHWADPSSLALMHYTARNTRKCSLLILGTYRPEDIAAKERHPLTETMQLMSREDLYEKMELQRLSQESISDFLSSMLEKNDFTDDFKNRIYEEAEGNPLFLIELMKLLVDENLIKSHEGVWTSEDPEKIHIPSKIHDLITRRLNRVGEEEREILDYASVMGDEFTSSVLSSATGLDKIRLLKHLRKLEQTHSLIHTKNGEFSFDHSKIKEVLYDEIPQELRMEYHSIVANSIETLYEDSPEEVIGDLAFHYYHCRNKEKALLYLEKAAEKAKKEFSNKEAIRFYTQALEFEEERKKKVELHKSLGDIYRLIGDYDNSIQSYNAALEFVEERRSAEIRTSISNIYHLKGEFEESLRIGTEAANLVKGEDSREEALALEQLGTVRWATGKYDRALEHYQESLAIGERIRDLEHVASVILRIGDVYVRKGESDKAIEYFERSLRIMGEDGDPETIASCLNGIGLSYNKKGDFERALKYYEKSLEISQRVGDQRRTAIQIGNIGLVHWRSGENDKALVNFEKSLEIHERIGDRVGIEANLRYIGTVLSDKGEYDRSLEYFQKSLEIGEKTGDKSGISGTLNNMGCLYEEMGEYDRALQCYKRSLKIAEEIGELHATALGLTNVGCVHLIKEEYDKAIEHHKKSLEIGEKYDLKTIIAANYRYMADAFLHIGNSARALDFCTRAIELSEEIGFTENTAIAKRVFGTICREQKRWNESIENLEESIRVLKEIGRKKELADSYYEFGLMWKGKGDADKAREHLHKAKEIYGELKLDKELTKTRKASSDL